MQNIAMAIGAHPDDIEFLMAGTLLLLGRAGWDLHYMTVANGSCGSAEHSASEISHIRGAESRAAAKLLGAVYHPPLVDDLEIFYEPRTLKRLAAVIREVQPKVLLIPSPQDYMEDHTNTCRLAVTAAFTRGMRNFRTIPSRKPIDSEVTIYHAMPHGLRDPLRQPVIPHAFVDIASVQDQKRAALAEHKSQQRWLDASQNMNEYLRTQEVFAQEVGRLSGRFKLAEGWRQHLHYGFCAPDTDPLQEVLKRKYCAGKSPAEAY